MKDCSSSVRREPFPHSTCSNLLPPELCEGLLDWFETDAPWKLRTASFYEQWEMHIEECMLPQNFHPFLSDETVSVLAEKMLTPLSGKAVRLTEVTAHKLLPGQTIRIHNDFVGDEETHRLLLQLNRGWEESNGGLLMLFSGSRPEDVSRVLRPTHGTLFAFKICPNSFHAVSTVRSGERYTLVYSFRDALEPAADGY
jgi:Rps23 Pro-64 3,4-dihydroxylase Tpa1-like proline 4-hydroxylase